MENKFLLYLLYIALIDIRALSYENKDNFTFGLCNLLHNIPLQLTSNDSAKSAYDDLLVKVESLGLSKLVEYKTDRILQSIS
jgi:hypothetical protein